VIDEVLKQVLNAAAFSAAREQAGPSAREQVPGANTA
jgi:hypothetical protein